MIHEYEQKGIIGTNDIRGILGTLWSFDLHDITDSIAGNYWGVSRCLFLSMIFWALFGVLWGMIPSLPLFAFGWLLGTAPIWLPIAMLISAWKVWVWYAHTGYILRRASVPL